MSKGNLLCAFYPQDNHPPSSAMATLTTRNGHAVLAFDDTVDFEDAHFHGIMPWNYDSANGLTVWLIWMAASATTLNVRWQVSIERHRDETDDLDSDSFDGTGLSALSVTATTAGTSGAVQYTKIALADGDDDDVEAGESFRLKVRRDGDVVADNMVGDAQLLAVELRETI